MANGTLETPVGVPAKIPDFVMKFNKETQTLSVMTEAPKQEVAP